MRTAEKWMDILGDFNRRQEIGHARRLRPLLVLMLFVVAWQLMPVFGWYEPYYYFFAVPPDWFGPFCFVSQQTAEMMRAVMQVQVMVQELLFLPALLLPSAYMLGYRVPDEIRILVPSRELLQGGASHLRLHGLISMGVLFILPMLAVSRSVYFRVDYLAAAMLACLLAYSVLCLAANELLVLAWLRRLSLAQVVVALFGIAGLYLAFRVLLHSRMLGVYQQISSTGTVSLRFQPEAVVLAWHLALLLLAAAGFAWLVSANRRFMTLSQ